MVQDRSRRRLRGAALPPAGGATSARALVAQRRPAAHGLAGVQVRRGGDMVEVFEDRSKA